MNELLACPQGQKDGRRSVSVGPWLTSTAAVFALPPKGGQRQKLPEIAFFFIFPPEWLHNFLLIRIFWDLYYHSLDDKLLWGSSMCENDVLGSLVCWPAFPFSCLINYNNQLTSCGVGHELCFKSLWRLWIYHQRWAISKNLEKALHNPWWIHALIKKAGFN